MYHKLNGQNIMLEKVEETLGRKFFMELKLIDKSVMLDHSVSGFLNQSMVANKVLSEFGFFLRFYERRNKFRFQLRQHLNEKNTMKKELSACVISKFNGYEFLRNSLKSKLSVFLHQKLEWVIAQILKFLDVVKKYFT